MDIKNFKLLCKELYELVGTYAKEESEFEYYEDCEFDIEGITLNYTNSDMGCGCCSDNWSKYITYEDLEKFQNKCTYKSK